MIKINLKPGQKKASIIETFSLENINKTFIIIIIFLVLVIAEFGYLIVLNIKHNDLLAKKQYLTTEKERLKAIERKINEKKKALAIQKKLKRDLEIRKKIFVKLSEQKSDFVPMLAGLGNSLVDGIWLKDIKLSRQNTSVKGFSFNTLYISTFYENLNKYFKQVSLDSTQRIKTKSDLVYYNFKIKAIKWRKNKEEKGDS